MTGLSHPTSPQPPSVITIYKLDEPVDTTLPADEQALQIFQRARLVELTVDAVQLAGNGDPEAVRDMTMQAIIETRAKANSSAVKAEVLKRLREFILNGYHLEGQSTAWNDGETQQHWLHFQTSYYGFVEEGLLKRLLVFHRDDSRHRYQSDLITNIAQNLATDSGDAFFGNLVRRLASTLELDYAFIAELDGEAEAGYKVLALYDRSKGALSEQPPGLFLSSLHSSGSEEFAGQCQIYTRGVSRLFPRNVALQQLAAEAYIAVPLLAEGNQPVGLLGLIHRSELLNPGLIKSVLEIFSVRASVEMQRRKAMEERRRRQLQQQIFIDNSPSGMFVADIDPPMPVALSVHQQVQWLADNTRFVDANKAFVKLFNFSSLDSLLGHSLFIEDRGYDFATTARDFISAEFEFRDHLIRFFSGENEIWVSVNITSVVEDGHVMQILGMMTDVTERVRHSREMEYEAKHDSLTGLPNRSSFIDQVEQAKRMSTPGSRHALFLLDLDGFKEVNDTLGHETGDYLLKQIGPRLESILAPSRSLLARLGGDEFAIFVEGYKELQSVTQLAADLMTAIKSPFEINELELVVGGSVGIALYPENADSVSSLLRCADVAMYQAKKDSVDFRLYSLQQDHYTVRRLSLMMDIRQAVENDELRLYYQPIVRLSDQAPVSFEALIRWEHPAHGMLSPAEFIPLIEITDMIMPVTWWVIETAIKQLAEWRDREWPYRISVNVSTRNLSDTGLVSFIESCLQRYGVDGKFLEIEITESTLMADPENARRLLQSIALLGVSMSIDDYGTGYSSLAYLKSLPINTLKIDRTFISQMLEDSQDIIIVNSTIQLAHNLGLDVTAEGIEELSLVNALVDLGCDKGQGFYFCEPIPVRDLEEWLLLQSRVSVAGQN